MTTRLFKSSLLQIFAILALVAFRVEGAKLTGETKQWHTVTLSFDGPYSSEAADVNPFFDYRMDVDFTHESGASYSVPGYFAADGQAGDTGAKEGDQWRVHFTPDQLGTWKYSVHFRQGDLIASKPIHEYPNAGDRISGVDGLSGSFEVTTSDKRGRDFRNPENGRLVFNGKSHLKYSGSERHFLKAGQGSPETFIAYYEFDDVRDLKGNFIHRYEVHGQHYDEAAAPYTWKNGKGKNLLGAINYLSQTGVNSQYVILTTLEGDGQDSWPWADPEDLTRYDCSKLDQWNRVFSYMNSKGLMLTCLLLETENEQIFDEGEAIGPERKVYFREMVARFAHLPAVSWIMSEETRLKDLFPADYNRQRIRYFRGIDPYNHPTGLHNGVINGMDFADVPEFDYFSLHSSADNWTQANAKILFRVNEAKWRGHPWVVFYDECVSARYGVPPDSQDPDHDLEREHGLWGTFLAGGGGISWYYGYKNPHNDLNCEDFTLREEMFRQSKIAIDFFEEHEIPFWEMESRNELVDSGLCLAKEGEIYVVQMDMPTFGKIQLFDDTEYEVFWFDPKTGGDLQKGTVSRIKGPGSVSLGRPSGDPERHWVNLIRATSAKGAAKSSESYFDEEGGLLVVEAEDLPRTKNWVVQSQSNGYTGDAYLHWQGTDSPSEPADEVIEVTIKVTSPGAYNFYTRGMEGVAWVRFPNASKIHAETIDGWIPLGGIDESSWSWSGKKGSVVQIDFEEPEYYTLQIAGGSKGAAIDRLVLRHSGVSQKKALSLSAAKSEVGSGVE
ncbi:DUF5060 domain-containing protein [Pelagicoccus mobilis]|uniref:DUF5060 domain-containing protein n=1 Tax=Pelagicoccus mobilis TaxID=415221 RepID=A0A934RS86_9BACT|nr:DUF5060 domain-containing protein [Pelagicoccus mobilis]MBK1875927.1 DUF5060 domain-containing protein [Pelagicoccus mobilis]